MLLNRAKAAGRPVRLELASDPANTADLKGWAPTGGGRRFVHDPAVEAMYAADGDDGIEVILEDSSGPPSPAGRTLAGGWRR